MNFLQVLVVVVDLFNWIIENFDRFLMKEDAGIVCLTPTRWRSSHESKGAISLSLFTLTEDV